ncbi:MAG TPA: sigma-70 family RNA polymerase sigma factor [Nitrosopumilaceae archaeon]|jgi:RNA polymerase sigma factor (sigma-70 family)|nr:sigma-70 family RNA polymerase sigma factor [Nitrosopumilaceae archaeon]
MSEAEQISLCQRNDRKGQRELYSNYYGKLMGLSLRYSKNKEEATDMLNKGFVKIYNQIGSFKNQTAFEDWIKGLFISHAVHYLKNNRQEYYITTTIKADEGRANADLFHQVADGDPNEISNEGYIKALQQLPPSFRSIFNLYVLDGYTHSQISETLEISEETSKLNLEKARFSLQRTIQQQLKGYS